MVIEGGKGWFNVMHIKFNPANSTRQNLKRQKPFLKNTILNILSNINFVDEEYAKKFQDEKRTERLRLICRTHHFHFLSGFVWLATYMAENRIKEIGVRKVLGASVTSITALLSKDFLKLVIVSL